MNIKVLAITLLFTFLGYFWLLKKTHPNCEAAAAATMPKVMKVIVTEGDKRFAEAASIEFKHGPIGKTTKPTITIDLAKTYQKWLGIGGAPTDAACYMLTTLQDEPRKKLIHELFSPTEGLGFNFLRIPMGSSDFATHVYSYDDSDEPDPELKKFNIDHDKKYILPRLREILEANPSTLSLMSPWSPPGWMKPNKSMCGGNMNFTYLDAWVEYFIKTAKAYAAEGVPVYAFTVQNEPDTDQQGKMPAAMTSSEVQGAVVANVARRRDEEKMTFKMWVNDHNYSQFGTVLSLFDNPDVLNASDGVAWHGYGGDPAKMTMIHDKYPTKHQYWTEGGPDVLTWEGKPNPDYTQDFAKWARIIAITQRNWCRVFIAWNIALDERSHPNIGPFPCGGIVTIDSKSGDITRSGQYYGMGHFSKYLKRDAVRVASEGDIADVTHVAWVNPDGQKLVVLVNEGKEARDICLKVGDEHAEVALAANSVTSLIW